jgi:hypothetical protein
MPQQVTTSSYPTDIGGQVILTSYHVEGSSLFQGGSRLS